MSSETEGGMDGIRKIEAGSALSWFTRAVDVGGRQARGLFAAAALGVLAMGAAAMVAALLLAVLVAAGLSPGEKPDIGRSMLVALPIILLFSLLMPVFGGGMQQVLHQAEAGRPVGAGDIFAGFVGGRFGSLAGLAILPLAGLALTLANYHVFGGPEYFAQYVAMLEEMTRGGQPVPPEVRSPALLFLVGMAINAVQTVLQLITVPLVQLSGRGTLGAIADGFRMMARNPGAVLTALALGLAAALVLAIVLAIGLMILALLAGLVPVLGVPLMLVLAFALMVVLFVIYHGIGYYAWRDQFGAPGRAPPAAPAQLEV
ncbi:hypothetical protein [Arenimonas fontis]|uniref:Uncharacterized protein n=1 Tax=Arenimonas fontis TaxID=2608255 RepID=A0A5B2ZAW4_9GAMM|nr:hypothetical protein [Arenimonas fontis]KAA2284272.1 hypothetical protein F0415_10280 [Arenimonas fontis]